MKKKLLSLLLVICMVASMIVAVPVSAATNGTCGPNLTWSLDDEGTLTISGTGYMDYCVHNWDMPVHFLDDFPPWNSFSSNIKNVIIGNGVTNIGPNAFSGCSSLTSLTIPDSVISIDFGAFSGCSSLTSLTIPDSVISIGGDAFSCCDSLTSLTIPDSVADIGENTFSGCSSLTSITIPDSVTSIGVLAFYGCSSLTSITIPDSVTSIGDGAFYGCSSLTSITIPDSVTSIGDGAFSGCSSLTSVAIPDRVTSIGDYTFEGCSSLTSVTIPDSVTSIGYHAFYETAIGIDNENWEDNVLYIDNCLIEAKSDLNGVYAIKNNTRLISNSAFENCSSLTSVTIPDSVTSIGVRAFEGCSSLTDVYYNGTEGEWNAVYIGTDNTIIKKATKHYFFYANILDTDGNVIVTDMVENNNTLDVSIIQQKTGHTMRLYADIGCTNEFEYTTTPITEDIDLYLQYKINQYNHKFVDYDGTVIKEENIDYGAIITAPTDPERPATEQYTYTFAGWEGYTDGMTQTAEDIVFTAKYTSTINQYNHKFVDYDGTVIKEENIDYGAIITAPTDPERPATEQYTYTFAGWEGYTDGMTQTAEDIVFTAKYTSTINQYTYQFIDMNGEVIEAKTVDYGTMITAPEIPLDKDPYTFDYWDGFANEMNVVGNVSFTAVYKYKQYTITVDKLGKEITVTYNDSYSLPIQEIKDFNFVGYYIEPNGNGQKLTNETGNSIGYYNFTDNITAYPHYVHLLANKMVIGGDEEVQVGTEGFIQTVSFATDKEAKYLTCTVKYPKVLEIAEVVEKDFALVNINSTETKDEFRYTKLTCMYDYSGGIIPLNQTITPFDLKFNVSKDAVTDDIAIEISDIILVGMENYSIGNVTKNVSVIPKIEISGPERIDASTKYTANVLPYYTTNKTVDWSVDNESVAAISEDGILTPLKNGTVNITATAKDGSGISASMNVQVTAYAKIDSILIDGVWDKEFSENIYEYTVYVKENVDSIDVTASYTNGALLVDGYLMLPGFEDYLELSNEETIFNFNMTNVTDETDSVYVIKVVKFEGTNTTISDDGKTFIVNPINIESGKTVILALYDGEILADTMFATYENECLTFTTDKSYTNAKVIVWENFSTLRSVCDVEVVK